MARKRKNQAGAALDELPTVDTTAVAEFVALATSGEDDGAGLPPYLTDPDAWFLARRRMSGDDLAGMLRQQRRETRLKEKGY